MNPSPARPFDTFADYRRAVLDALGAAHHSIAIFDPDLAECGLETSSALEFLEHFCLEARRDDALRILLLDHSHLEKRCPRLCALLLRFAHRVGIRLADADAQRSTRPFILVDHNRVVSRFDRRLPRGCDETTDIACFITQFETLWTRGTPYTPCAVLGL